MNSIVNGMTIIVYILRLFNLYLTRSMNQFNYHIFAK